MPSIEELNAAAEAGKLDGFFRRSGTVARDITKLATQAQVSGLGALVRGIDDVDEAEVARLVLPGLVEALAGELGLTVEEVEAATERAVRKVAADAAE